MCTYKVDVLWLDECAEALRNCALAYDSYLAMKQNLMGSERRSLAKFDIFETNVEEQQRQICYSIGVVSCRLIQFNTAGDEADKKNLNKLNILQGGVEARFIPSLTKETKI